VAGTIASLEAPAFLEERLLDSRPSLTANYPNVLFFEPGNADAYFTEDEVESLFDTCVSLHDKRLGLSPRVAQPVKTLFARR
jgi:hypothetical protein